MPALPVALQLFTVRDAIKEDCPAALRKVREIGYEMVQPTGGMPYTYSADELAVMLSDIGLGAAGIHVRLDELDEAPEYWAEYATTAGTRDLVVPSIPPELRSSREDWLAVAARLDALGARYKELGVRLSYHNHSFEFEKYDGDYGLDLLYANSAPDHLYAELDTYWIKHGGEDPVDYIRRHAGRVPVLHVKDMADDEERSFAEIGQGTLDWPAIVAAAADGGTEYLCVEQDRCKGDPMESARISWEFLRDLLG